MRIKSDAVQLAEAAKRRSASFTTATLAARNDVIRIGGLVVPTLGLAVGHLSAITYQSIGDGRTYTHNFNARNRPLVYVNSDGRQIYILEGGYKFTGGAHRIAPLGDGAFSWLGA